MADFDLHIALRVYPGVSKSPFIFPDNKLRLFKTGIYSLKESLQGIHYKITVILDRCPEPFHEAVKEVFNEIRNFKIVPLVDGGNAKSFLKQIDVLLERQDSSVVMFAEDDYIYYGSNLNILVELLKAKRADFATPYDHLDYYTLLIHRKNIQEEFKQRIFKNVNSTCLTFLTTPVVLKATRKVFETYMRRNSDTSIFWSLTKEHVLSPSSLISFIKVAILGNALFLKLFTKAWIHSPTQILFGKRYKILASQPSIATHLEKGTLAPGIDWNKRVSELIKQYNI